MNLGWKIQGDLKRLRMPLEKIPVSVLEGRRWKRMGEGVNMEEDKKERKISEKESI